MASLAFCVALAMMTSAISSIAEATDAGDWYVDLGKSERTKPTDTGTRMRVLVRYVHHAGRSSYLANQAL